MATLKKLLLTGIAVLLLATGAAHAGSYRITGGPDHSKCANCRTAADHKLFSCIFYYIKKHDQDPRFQRTQYGDLSGALSLGVEGKRACRR
jgi:hypothetical protein